jgi:hypothetical protein
MLHSNGNARTADTACTKHHQALWGRLARVPYQSLINVTYACIHKLVAIKLRVLVHAVMGTAEGNTRETPTKQTGIDRIETIEKAGEPRLGAFG